MAQLGMEILSPLPAGMVLPGCRIEACIKRTALGFLYRCGETAGEPLSLLEFCPAGLWLFREEGVVQVPAGSQAAFCRGLGEFYRIGQGLLEARGSRNLPEAVDLFEAKGTVYFLLHPPAGIPLSHLPRQLTEGEFLRYAQALSDGLIIAHSLGLIHGEIRSDQIYLEGESIRLSGFFAPCLFRMQNRPVPDPAEDLRGLGESLYQAYVGRRADRGREGLLLPDHLRSTWERLLLSGGRRGFSSVLEFKHALTCLCPVGE